VFEELIWIFTDKIQFIFFAIRMSLATVDIMKEKLRQFWQQPSYVPTALFLDDWIKRSIISGFKMLIEFANTFGRLSYRIAGLL